MRGATPSYRILHWKSCNWNVHIKEYNMLQEIIYIQTYQERAYTCVTLVNILGKCVDSLLHADTDTCTHTEAYPM